MANRTYVPPLTIFEYKQKIAKIFHAPVDSIQLSDEFISNREQFVAVYQQILYLSSKYDLRNVTSKRVMFQSEGICYGKVTLDPGAGQNLKCINFGDNPRAAFLNGCFSNRLREKAIDRLVVTHEFAHVVSASARALEPVETRYWQELAELWQSYQDFEKTLTAYGGLISKYSFTSIDEFHAEAFTEYHLSDTPSRYAMRVGKLIDKYFTKASLKKLEDV